MGVAEQKAGDTARRDNGPVRRAVHARPPCRGQVHDAAVEVNHNRGRQRRRITLLHTYSSPQPPINGSGRPDRSASAGGTVVGPLTPTPTRTAGERGFLARTQPAQGGFP